MRMELELALLVLSGFRGAARVWPEVLEKDMWAVTLCVAHFVPDSDISRGTSALQARATSCSCPGPHEVVVGDGHVGAARLADALDGRRRPPHPSRAANRGPWAWEARVAEDPAGSGCSRGCARIGGAARVRAAGEAGQERAGRPGPFTFRAFPSEA